MKTLIRIFAIIAIVVSVLVILSGCTTTYDENLVQYDLPISHIACYGINEWISPDGVCYWVFEFHGGISVAPRFGRNGKVVMMEENSKWN